MALPLNQKHSGRFWAAVIGSLFILAVSLGDGTGLLSDGVMFLVIVATIIVTAGVILGIAIDLKKLRMGLAAWMLVLVVVSLLVIGGSLLLRWIGVMESSVPTRIGTLAHLIFMGIALHDLASLTRPMAYLAEHGDKLTGRVRSEVLEATTEPNHAADDAGT